MLEKSDTSMADTLAIFNRYDHDVGLLMSTEPGMKKFIMDAAASVRDYLHDMGFHDYDAQASGPRCHGNSAYRLCLESPVHLWLRPWRKIAS